MSGKVYTNTKPCRVGFSHFKAHLIHIFQTISKVHEWESLHQHPGQSPCPCTCISSHGNDMVVSAGEDGRINVLNLGHRKPVRVLGRLSEWSYLNYF